MSSASALIRLDDGRLVAGNRSGGFDEHRDPGLFVFDAWGALPETCQPREPFESQSAPMDLVSVELSTPERAVTVTRVAHELMLTSTSSAVASCLEDIVIRPPTEVSPPGAVVPLRVDAGSVVSWEDGALSSSTSFNLHRGALGELAAGGSASCLLSELTIPSAVDAELPSPSEGWYYLVAGVNEGGEGPVGNDSQGSARATPGACP
ncbi:MAG: hypothetical protein AAF533_27095 [Acidobacteriota bacterium]